ncbi:hypothetical protein Plhal703r1_c40g0138771 [Plasmopara halstedii]
MTQSINIFNIHDDSSSRCQRVAVLAHKLKLFPRHHFNPAWQFRKMDCRTTNALADGVYPPAASSTHPTPNKASTVPLDTLRDSDDVLYTI